MADAAVLAPRGQTQTQASRTRRLLVCWQDPESRRYDAVGELSHDGHRYRFAYLAPDRLPTGFRFLLGFPQLELVYESGSLFALFAQRVVDPRRPDRARWLEDLALGIDASPMEFLARSGGRRGGDALELLPVPDVDDGMSHCVFLVHGVRHQSDVEAALQRLHEGDRLVLRPEPENDVDSRALLVTRDGSTLGWVPNPLLDHVHAMLTVEAPTVSVVRVNGPQAGHHLRLMVRLEGRVPTGYQFRP